MRTGATSLDGLLERVASVVRPAIHVLLIGGAVTRPLSQPARGQAPSGIFIANVADATTKAPLPDALVFIADLGRGGRTDWIGEVHLGPVPRGRHRVSVRHIGYVPAAVDIEVTRDTVGLVFMLAPSPPLLDTVRTSALSGTLRLHDFELRRRMGIGRFLTDSALARQASQPIATIMAGHFPGVYSAWMDRGVMRRNCDTRLSPPRDGRPDVYVDGVRLGLTQSNVGSIVPPSDALDLRFIDGADVAGIEYYTEASAPAQYRRPGMVCGVILIWLR